MCRQDVHDRSERRRVVATESRPWRKCGPPTARLSSDGYRHLRCAVERARVMIDCVRLTIFPTLAGVGLLLALPMISVIPSAQAAVCPRAESTPTVAAPGQTVVVSGNSCARSAIEVDFAQRGRSRQLRRSMTQPNGRFVVRVTIPRTAPAGSSQLVVTFPNSCRPCGHAELFLPERIAGAALPFTGTPATQLIAAALLAIVAGAALTWRIGG